MSTHFSLKSSDLKQRSRITKIALARQVAMYILWRTNKYTLSEIGKALGGRSPATVSYGFQKIAQNIKRNSTIKSKVSQITEELLVGDIPTVVQFSKEVTWQQK